MPRHQAKRHAGEAFGLWTLVSRVEGQRWLARCQCGREAVVWTQHLVTGRSRSCGCIAGGAQRRELPTRQIPEYKLWAGMIDRCENPNAPQYRHYGGRGITVCDRWRHDFDAFLADLGPRPSPKHEIDRRDVNGSYEPGNVRWVTHKRQMRNTRTNRRLTVGVITMTIAEWGDATGVRASTISRRLRLGWSAEDAVRTPVGRHGAASPVQQATPQP